MSRRSRARAFSPSAGASTFYGQQGRIFLAVDTATAASANPPGQTGHSATFRCVPPADPAPPRASSSGPDAIIEALRDYAMPDCDGGSSCPWRLDHRAFSGLSRPPRAGYLTAYDAQPDRRRPALASLCDRFLPLADLPLSTRGWSDQQTYGTGKIGKGAEMGSNMSSRHVRRRALAPPDPPVLSRRLAYAVDKHHSSVEGWPSG